MGQDKCPDIQYLIYSYEVIKVETDYPHLGDRVTELYTSCPKLYRK